MRLIDDNGEINFWATDAGKTRRPIPLHQPITSISGCSDDLLPPSPPAEKAAARKDQAGEASTGDGTRNSGGGCTNYLRGGS